MTKATILSLEQTDVAGLFTIIFEGESESEFVKFVSKLKDDAVRKNELRVILNQIEVMLQKGIESLVRMGKNMTYKNEIQYETRHKRQRVVASNH